MDDVSGLKLSEIDLLSEPLTVGSLFYVVRDDVPYRATLQQLLDFAQAQAAIVPELVPYRGAILSRTTTQTGVVNTTPVSWEAASFDTDSFWSAGAPTRLTIPSGITKVRLLWSVFYGTSATAGSASILLHKNGSSATSPDFWGRTTARQGTTGFSNNEASGMSAALAVSPGDYFELVASISGISTSTIEASSRTVFELEVLEAEEA